MTRRTVAATALGFDAAEMGHYLYQPARFTAPVWAVGDQYCTVATVAELQRLDKQRQIASEDWAPHSDQYAQRLAQTMNPPRTIWTTR